jgi:nucleoside-diphosphate-sugar epimerase
MRIFAKNMRTMANKAIIAGSSGLIGSNLLDILLQEAFYDEVLILVRKELPIQHPKLTQLVVDFDQLETYADQLTGHAIFCCLAQPGTKRRIRTVYRKIDHDYPLILAQLAHKNGVEQYHLVSSIGANTKHLLPFILKQRRNRGRYTAGRVSCSAYLSPIAVNWQAAGKRVEEKIVTALYKVIDPFIWELKKIQKYSRRATVAAAMYKQSIKTEYRHVYIRV